MFLCGKTRLVAEQADHRLVLTARSSRRTSQPQAHKQEAAVGISAHVVWRGAETQTDAAWCSHRATVGSSFFSSVCSGSQKSQSSVVPHSVQRGFWEHCLLRWQCVKLCSPLYISGSEVGEEKSCVHLVWGEGWGWRRIWCSPAQADTEWGHNSLAQTLRCYSCESLAGLLRRDYKNHIMQCRLHLGNPLPQDARKTANLGKLRPIGEQW